MGTPPKITSVLISGMFLRKRMNSLLIWKASSLLWQRIIADTGLGFSGSCWRVVKTNTAVLPIPDLAWQRMSTPIIALGMHSYCTSEGCSKPQSVIARLSSGLRSISLKLVVVWASPPVAMRCLKEWNLEKVFPRESFCYRKWWPTCLQRRQPRPCFLRRIRSLARVALWTF